MSSELYYCDCLRYCGGQRIIVSYLTYRRHEQYRDLLAAIPQTLVAAHSGPAAVTPAISTAVAPTGAVAEPSNQAALSLALSTPTNITPSSGFSNMDSNLATQDLVGQLELHISANSIGLYPPPPTNIDSDLLAAQAMTPQPPQNTNNDIRLLSGPLDAFLKYSRQEHSKWLIDIAHDICDPAHLRGNLLVWNRGVQQWRPVAYTDPLTASIYLYVVPVGVFVGLSKMSSRSGKSVTTATGHASTMADRVNGRDGECWVTGITYPLSNSHICPKRMGDHLARIIFRDFSSASSPIPNLSIDDERFGISFTTNLDTYFDIYELGLRFVSANQYECHVFRADDPGRVHTIFGQAMLPTTLPILHGHNASPPRPQLTTNPPPGLIRWHYLQCVLKKFGHTDYKMLPNIKFWELPLRMEEDSDGADSDAEWPSADLDRGRAVQASIEDKEHRHRAVANWIGTV